MRCPPLRPPPRATPLAIALCCAGRRAAAALLARWLRVGPPPPRGLAVAPLAAAKPARWPPCTPPLLRAAACRWPHAHQRRQVPLRVRLRCTLLPPEAAARERRRVP